MLTENSFERLSDDIIEVAENVTLSILERLQRIARLLVENPESNINREAIRREVEQLWEQYFTQAQQWTDESLPQAYLMGIERANGETPDTEAPFGFNPQPIIAGISAGGGTISGNAAEFLKDYPKHHTMYTAFQDAAYSEFQKTRLPVVRDVRGKLRDLIVMASEDAYKDAGGFTRRKITQRLMNKFADDNITGVRYRDGRTMKLDTYSEMVARSQTGNAARQASLNRQQEYGIDLIQISQHYPTSDLCYPYQGRVFSVSGTSSKYPPFSEALDGGLYHPNCKHFQSGYIEGTSILPDEELKKSKNREQYKIEQKQRYNERQIRYWKRREAVAITEDERKRARQIVSKWQAENRQLVDNHSYLRRKYHRESITGDRKNPR